MEKKFKKLLAMALSLVMLATFCAVPMTASAEDTNLKFGTDGKFKIVVFSDVQDQYPVHQRVIRIMEQAIEREKPDLVVFNGDNTEINTKDPEVDYRRTVEQILAPVIEAGVPYALVFGNHDPQSYYQGQVTSKDAMLAVWQSIGDCRTTDPAPELTGTGTCKIPIYASNGSKVAFNLWMIDSNSYQNPLDTTSGFDNPHADQLAWIEENNDADVNSIAFQHIPMPETWNLYVEDPNGTGSYGGKKYRLELKEGVTGIVTEFPSSIYAEDNTGEFATFKKMGNVLGVFNGHDHLNDFSGTYDGIGITSIPGMTYFNYGDEAIRGYGVIELDEADLSTYDYHTVKFSTLDAESDASTETTYDVYDEITYADLKENGNALGSEYTISGGHTFTYDATSPSYSAIFKFRWTAGSKPGYQVSFDLGNNGNISYPFGLWIKRADQTGPNGAWHLKPNVPNLEVKMNSAITKGDVFDIELGRLKVLTGEPQYVGQYYVYLKVNGVLIQEGYTNTDENGGYTSDGADCQVSNVIRFGGWDNGGDDKISASPFIEEYEAYDEITYEDLIIGDNPAAVSGIHLGSTREYTYNATSKTFSTIFKYRWIAGTSPEYSLYYDYWGNYPFGLAVKGPNSGKGGGVEAGPNGAWHVNPSKGGNIVNMSEPIVAGQAYDIEFARLKVKNGENKGKYYVYLKVNGELIQGYYTEATEELTNKILFVSSTEDNSICATPEYYAYDEITYDDLFIGGNPAASSGIDLGSTREYTYNATSETYSTSFNFRWTAGTSPEFSLYFDYWGNYPFGLAVKGPNSGKGGGITAGENGAWHVNPSMGGNMVNMSEPIVAGQTYDIEFGRIKVKTGTERGKYYVYLKVDGELIQGYYTEATEELTNKILFVSSTEDNFISGFAEEEPEVDPEPDSPYYAYDEIGFNDLFVGDTSMAGLTMITTQNYTYNATSPTYSMILKYRWIPGGNEMKFTTFLDDWVYPFCFAVKTPNQSGFGDTAGPNGSWHLVPSNGSLMVNMDEPIVAGKAYDIEIARLKVKNGENADKYYVYAKVNGELIQEYYYDGVVDGVYEGTALSNKIIISLPDAPGNKITATPFAEEYEAYDEIGFNDLFEGDISMSGMTIESTKTYTYNATSSTYSMKLKYRWIAGGNEMKFTTYLDDWVFPFCFAVKTPNQSGFGDTAGPNGAWHLVPSNGSLMVNMDEPIVAGRAYDIEIGRLKVANGSNAGKYYVYFMVDGVLIQSYYYGGVVDGVYEGTALSNKIIISLPEAPGNKITAIPFVEEYETYDEIGFDDLSSNEATLPEVENNDYIYNATSPTYSVKFKFRWIAGTDPKMSFMFDSWNDFAFFFAAKRPNETGFGAAAGANGAWHLVPSNPDLIVQMDEPIVSGRGYNIEVGRLKVKNGSNAGKYYVYWMVDGNLIQSYYYDGVVDGVYGSNNVALSNTIIIAPEEGNRVTAYKEIGSNEHEGVRGDFDNNGVIDAADLVTLTKILLGAEDTTDKPEGIADFNNDGNVNILDFIAMKKYLAPANTYAKSDSLVLGTQEHLLEDYTKTAEYIADASATLGATAYRLSMPIHNLYYATSANGVAVREDNMNEFKDMVAKLKAKGIDQILYVTDSYILPFGYADEKSHNITIPDPLTDAENYVAWLNVNAAAFKALAQEVPEIKFFEPFNEINVKTTRFERYGIGWDATSTQQAEYKFTVKEKAAIMADLCYYISEAVKSVDSANKVTTPSIVVGSNSVIEKNFIEEFYKAIESGSHPTNKALGDKRVDNYFTIVNLHAYPDYTEDDAWIGNNFESNAKAEINEWAGYINEAYNVVKAHDDGGSRVWLTETGMSTYHSNGNERNEDNVARLIQLALEKLDKELTFIDTAIFYKIADMSSDKDAIPSEIYFGFFRSGDDLDNPYEAKPSAKAIYSFFHNGTTDYSALDALVSRYAE